MITNCLYMQEGPSLALGASTVEEGKSKEGHSSSLIGKPAQPWLQHLRIPNTDFALSRRREATASNCLPAEISPRLPVWRPRARETNAPSLKMQEFVNFPAAT